MRVSTYAVVHQRRHRLPQRPLQETTATPSPGRPLIQRRRKGYRSLSGIRTAPQNRTRRTSTDSMSIQHVDYHSCNEYSTVSNVKIPEAALASPNVGINHLPPQETNLSSVCRRMDLLVATPCMDNPTCPAVPTLRN
jgi:hypothetical protein